jgi:hypothetical protein
MAVHQTHAQHGRHGPCMRPPRRPGTRGCATSGSGRRWRR